MERKEKSNEAIEKTRSLWADYLIMLAVPVIVAWYYYGIRVFELIAVGVASAVLCELAAYKLMMVRPTLGDCNAIFIGAAIALMLPASSEFWLPLLGSAFAVFAVKMPFGGAEHSPFSPVAAAMAFLTLCFPDKVFAYPQITDGGSVAAFGTPEFVQGSSLTSMLSQGNALKLNIISVFDVLTGNIPGAAGTCCVLVLFACLIYLIIRRPRLFVAAAGFILSSAVVAGFFPRVLRDLLNTTAGSAAVGYHLMSLLLEMSAGYLVFAAIFLITDPATLPETLPGRFFCGVFAGTLCMLMRYFGAFEESVCFAVLITNAFWPLADKYIVKLIKKTKGGASKKLRR